VTLLQPFRVRFIRTKPQITLSNNTSTMQNRSLSRPNASNHSDGFTFTNKKQTLWLESASELHPPSDRRLSAKLVPTFADRGVPRGQRDGSLRPYSSLSEGRTGEDWKPTNRNVKIIAVNCYELKLSRFWLGAH
jgi:hypothetical protein